MAVAFLVLWALFGHGHHGHAQPVRVPCLAFNNRAVYADLLLDQSVVPTLIVGVIAANATDRPATFSTSFGGVTRTVTIPPHTAETTTLLPVGIVLDQWTLGGSFG